MTGMGALVSMACDNFVHICDCSGRFCLECMTSRASTGSCSDIQVPEDKFASNQASHTVVVTSHMQCAALQMPAMTALRASPLS